MSSLICQKKKKKNALGANVPLLECFPRALVWNILPLEDVPY